MTSSSRPTARLARNAVTVGTLSMALLLLLVWRAVAGLDSVAGLFTAGQYEAARDALTAPEATPRAGEALLWQSRLARDPEVALSLLASAAEDQSAPPQVRVRATLEAAEIQAGRGRHREVYALLQPLFSAEEAEVPGIAYLRAGLSLRALGQLQQAREMLASVRPNDPEFVLARYYLGDIGLEQNDATLARRYFDAADRAAEPARKSRLAAGLWLAMRNAGENEDAAYLADRLAEVDPGSLALLEIRRLIQMEEDEIIARTESRDADTVVTPVTVSTGRYSLQIGAFSDRGLALEFAKRFQDELPDLRIDKFRDDRGQFLYKVRLGDYVNPALARAEARKLEQRLNIEVITTETTPIVGTTSNR